MASVLHPSASQAQSGSHSAAGGFSAIMEVWAQEATEMLLRPQHPSIESTQVICDLIGKQQAHWEGTIGQLLWRSSVAGIVAIRATAVTYTEDSVRLILTLHNGEEGRLEWPVLNGKTLMLSLQEEDAARLACWILCNTLNMTITVVTHAHVHACRNPFCRRQHQVHETLAHKDIADNYLYDSKLRSFVELNVKQWIGKKKPAADDICFPKNLVAMVSNAMVVCRQLRVIDKTISITSFPSELAPLLETRVPRSRKIDSQLILAKDSTIPALVLERVRPTRLYSCSKRALQQKTEDGPFGCVSYVWTQYTDDNELTKELQRVSAITGIDKWWVDRWCIKQDDPEDKSREIPRMRDYYSNADVTALLMPDVTMTMTEIPQDTEIFNAVYSRNQNSQLLGQVLDSMWSKRIWTIQEGVMARKILILTQRQCLPGGFLDSLLDPEYCPVEESAWSTIDPMGPLEPMLHGPCAWWNNGKLCIKRSLFGREYNQWWGSNVGMRSQRMDSAEVLAVTAKRTCTIESDMIYGMAGLIKGGDKLIVDYNMEPEALMAHAFEVGALGLEALMTATVSQKNGRCWAPRTLHDLSTYSGSWRLSGMQNIAKVTVNGLLIRGHLVRREAGVWEDGEGLGLEDSRGHEYKNGTYVIFSPPGKHNMYIAVLCGEILGNIVHREKSVVVKAIVVPLGEVFCIGY